MSSYFNTIGSWFNCIAIGVMVVLLPVHEVTAQGFVPCSGNQCNLCHLAQMANSILIWLVGFMFIIFAVIMVIAGFGLISSGGNPAAKQAAKDKFVNAIIGLIIALSAWLLVDTIMRGLLSSGDGTLQGWGPWSEVQCWGTQRDTRVEASDLFYEDELAVAPTNPGSFAVGADSLLGPDCNPGTENFPRCAEVNIATNDNMNPIFECTSGGCSGMVRPGAEERMQETLNGPFAVLQRNFGQQLVINDAIAKAGTSRETNTPGSRHFYGDAIDISLAGLSNDDRLRLVNEARAAGFTGFGLGNNILHVDRRPGAPVAWSYNNSTYGGVSVNSLEAQIEGR